MYPLRPLGDVSLLALQHLEMHDPANTGPHNWQQGKTSGAPLGNAANRAARFASSEDDPSSSSTGCSHIRKPDVRVAVRGCPELLKLREKRVDGNIVTEL